MALLGQKNYDAAEPFLLGGYGGLTERASKIPAGSKRLLKEAGERLVQLYEAWGKPDKAAEWRNRQAA